MDIIHQDENVKVETDDYVDGSFRFAQGIFKVTFTKGLGLRGKTFKGETAWSDSRRWAEDQLASKGIHTFLNW